MTFLGSLTDTIYNNIALLTEVYVSTSTQNGGTIPAANLAGGQVTVASFSGQTTAQALTFDTWQNLISRLQNCTLQEITAQGYFAGGSTGGLARIPPPGLAVWVNISYILRIANNNTSLGAITLTANTNQSIVGASTIAVGAYRDYAVTIGGRSGPFTFTSIGSGTN
jgi:hypothetical protein